LKFHGAVPVEPAKDATIYLLLQLLKDVWFKFHLDCSFIFAVKNATVFSYTFLRAMQELYANVCCKSVFQKSWL